MLDVVVVDGTPTITYKTDTIEFRADAYNMKENATVEDLVKKMEGMEVDKDGALTVQGEAVTKARINGKDYFGGDVAAALKDLPSDIVDKIQIVDDYGDEARRTGVKDGDPRRVLNIVTKSNKRVGNRGRFEAGAGSNDRYQLTANGNRFNGNQQIGIRSSFNNTVTGIASSDSGDSGGGGFQQGGGNRGQGGGLQREGNQGGGGSGAAGTRQAGRFGLNYNDDLTTKIKLESSYNYNGTNSNSHSESSSRETVKDINDNIQTLYGNRNSDNQNKSYGHSIAAKLEYEIDSANWLVISPTLNLRKTSTENVSTLFQTGAYKQDRKTRSNSEGSTPNYGLTLNYGHRFNKKGTTASIQMSANNSENTSERDAINNILYYDNITSAEVKDSLYHRLVANRNLSENYRGSLTFSHPISQKSRIEFNGQMNHRGYDNSQTTDQIDQQGNSNTIDSVSKIFNYSFTESRISLNYRYSQQTKANFSLGLSAVPGVLSGYSESRGNSTHRTSFNIIPIARFEYRWTRQKRFSINYTGNPTEPTFDQIQDVPDISNPQNTIIGNPDLKAAFRHSIQANFNNYISQTKLNYYAGLNATFNENQVVRNSIDIPDNYGARKKETRFVNASGNYSYNGNYGISKRFGGNKYNVSYNGSTGFNRTLSMNNNRENISKNWNFNQRLNLQIDPNDWLEVNPNIRYKYTQGDFSLNQNLNNKIQNWAFSLSSKIYFIKTLYLNYDLSKNLVKGIDANITTNPFIINASLTKEFFKRREGAISLRAYDLLNQNNFINRQNNPDGSVIDTKSNALSRYFILSLTWTPQKWTGGRNSSGQSFQRRGDGSYMGR